jgi:small GTP-binding protein
MDMEEKKFMKKICMLGEMAVGKSSLVRRFVHNVFSDTYLSTIGAKVMKKEVQLEDALVKLMIWDIIGFVKYDTLLKSYSKGSHGGFIVFDTTREETFKAIEEWADVFTQDGEKRNIMIIGNKVDLEPGFDVEARVEALTGEHGWKYILTSAKSGENVEDAFKTMARDILDL